MTLDQILAEAYQNGNVYHGWISAAIGAAGSIIGGLFGSKKKTETSESTSTSSVNYQQMVDDAMAAGFNPLTAIRNGGTGGYVTTHTKGKNITSGGGASIGAGIADAAAQIAPMFGSIGQKVDPIKVKNKTTGAISPLVAQQLKGSTLRAGSVVVAPRQTTRNSPTTRVGPQQRDSKGNKPGEGKLVGGDDPTVSSMGWNNGRYGLFHAPWMPDAEVNETIYGDNEVNSMIYTLGKWANDGGYSAYRNYQSLKDDWTNPKSPFRQHLKDKIRENNYREAAKRPFNPRPIPPKGYRYAN